MSEHRGHGQHEIEHIGDTVDHISNLPECILHHILSFMPTKEVVKTSILSTRWKNLWVSVPNLDFDNNVWLRRGFDDRHWFEVSFMNFVERVLHSRSASNIEKFCLSLSFFSHTCNKSEIRSCISSAIMHNVWELDLSLNVQDPSLIPRSLFDNTSLVFLKIRIHCVMDLPSYISFPCLKILKLYCVVFPSEDYIKKLLSGCPALEEFVLSGCDLMNAKNTKISCSTLKSLTIDKLNKFYHHDGHEIEIDAANLTYFEYIGNRSNRILMKNVSSLVKACIHIRQLEDPCQGVDLLKQLRNVVSLRLSNRTLESLTWADNIRFPVFPNLTHLMLTEEFGNFAFGAVMNLLSFCPVLQSICFSKGFMHFMPLGENNSVWSSIPICIKNCLKTVTFKNFHGYDSEICFLKYVLQYGCVLERIDVWWSETYVRDLKWKTKVSTEVEKIERRSTACAINFS